ncbi:hypothetical protein [Proteus vulgaris]|uniref:Uncharacterized protein n=1 Tax=Proteus vulgaris TaxID=585 RepID=A0A6G6SNS0_PROVU|nr:hypothetical protein [Proteus vulgaris]QIF94689.1 hypothetical protein GTH24_12585 [Proteus vulgaris]
MKIAAVNDSNSMSPLKITHPESKKNSILTTEVKEVKNISSPLLTYNNVTYETIDIGTQNEIEAPSFSTFVPKNPIKISENISEIKNEGMVDDKSEIIRNYHFSKEQDIKRQNEIKDESKSKEYAKKRNEEVINKLSNYRELYSTSIDEFDNKNVDNRYNLNSSDFSIIKNKIESKELSKKEKTSIIKKYLKDNDIFMKKMGFVEKIKNIFGKSEKINCIKREQATDALNILNKFIEDSENININRK